MKKKIVHLCKEKKKKKKKGMPSLNGPSPLHLTSLHVAVFRAGPPHSIEIPGLVFFGLERDHRDGSQECLLTLGNRKYHSVTHPIIYCKIFLRLEWQREDEKIISFSENDRSRFFCFIRCLLFMYLMSNQMVVYASVT